MKEPVAQLGHTDGAGRGVGFVPTTVACSWQPNPAHGAPPPCWVAAATDRQRLEYACAVLRHYAISVYPALGEDPETTAERLRAAILTGLPDDSGAYLFWTGPDDDACFTPDGRMKGPLTVYRDGTGTPADTAFHAALHLVALTAHPGRRPNTWTVTPRSDHRT